MANGLIGGIYTSLVQANAEPARHGLEAQVRTKFSVARMFVRTYFQARKNTELFKDVHTYCLFVGHARSGSSLVGGLLDAHPSVIIADEVDVFQYVTAGFDRGQIFNILLERSQRQARKGKVKAGRDAKQYSYQVPGQWNGDFDKLTVIGNRKAGISSQRIGQDPKLVNRLLKVLKPGIRMKTILTVRNPYDTISTMNIRTGKALEPRIKQYFANCDAIVQLQQSLPPEDFLVLRHEDLLKQPEKHLLQICGCLNITAYPEYLRACSSVLFRSPAESRTKVDWPVDLVQAVKDRIAQYEFLHGYSFDS